jgi:hypothetical protein
LIFTIAITVFLLAPMLFACCALLSEAHALLHGLATADNKGLPLPNWLAGTPLTGPWLAAPWQERLAGPEVLSSLTKHADPGQLLGWAQSLGQFTFRHALTVGFTVLLLSISTPLARGRCTQRNIAACRRPALRRPTDDGLDLRYGHRPITPLTCATK